jgi:prepilin-type N-terminal cleavage/methylation domain-containing protein
MMNTLRQHATDEQGFTLTELLVALVVTLVMGATALSTVVETYRTAANAGTLTDVNQNLRVAVNIVNRDLLQTGLDIPVGGISMPVGAEPVVRPGPTGSDLEFPDDWVTIPSVTPGPGDGPIVNGVATDIVTVLRSDVRLPWQNTPVVAVTPDGQRITFAGDFPIDDEVDGIKEGDLMMLTANAGSTLMEVTDVVGQSVFFAPSAESNLNQHAAPGGVLALREGGVFINVVARRILMITYYLDTSTSTPTLMRRTNYNDERKLAVGIENFQLTWDLVDGVDNPANVDEPEPPNTPHQIRKANLHMGARSLDRTSTGIFLRSNLNTQIALRSLAFVDRYR